MFRKVIIVIVILLVLSASAVSAYDLRNPLYFDVFPGFEGLVLLSVTGIGYLLTGPDQDDPSGYYHGNTFYLNGLCGYYPSYEDADTNVLESRIGFGYYFLSWFGVGLEVNASALTDQQTGTYGVGCLAYFRWRFPIAQAVTVFFDYGIGMIFSGTEFPTSGTALNFMPIYEMGVNIHLRTAHYLLLGVRHFHISNHQEIHNPGFNSNGFFLGYEFVL